MAGQAGRADNAMNVRFKMSLWQRIKAATSMWWEIVVTGEIECTDSDEEEPIAPGININEAQS